MSERERCENCGRELHPLNTYWLELSFKTGRWYEPGECPPEESQGGFPFGRACRLAVLAKQSAKDDEPDGDDYADRAEWKARL